MNRFVKRKIAVSMLFLALVMLGIFSYRSLPVELFPSAELPVLYLHVGYSSQLDPSFVEKDAVIPLEGMASEQAGVEEMESNITRQQATIIISFRQDIDINYAYHQLEQKVRAFQREHREHYMVNLIRVNTDMSANRFMTIQARGHGDIDRIRNVVDQEVRSELLAVDGVGDATVHGGQEKTIEVIFEEEACEALNITPGRISDRINMYSNQRLYGGRVYDAGKTWMVSVSGEYADIHELGNIPLDNQGKISLRDVADISMGEKEQETISRVNGMEAVTITVYNDANVNDIALYHELQDAIRNLNSGLQTKGVELVIQSSDAETMEDNMQQILNLALIGGIMAVFVLWIFLRNIRLVTVVALAIPISIFTSLNLFFAAGISLNTLSLMGMALAIGMLLDNSVVVLENIYRLKTEGASAGEAASGGTRQVLRAVVAATLTTVAVFLPFAFSSEFFIKLLGNNVGFSIISTLMVSLFVALIFIPVVVYQFLRARRKTLTLHTINFRNKVVRVYLIVLRFCLRHPAQVLFSMVLLFFASVVISLSISVNTLQETGTDTFRVSITMPGGATLETSGELVGDMEESLSGIQELDEVISNIEAGEATLTLKLKEDFEKIDSRSVAQIKDDVLDRLNIYNDVHVSISDMSSEGDGGMSGGSSAGAFMNFLGVGQQTEEVLIKGTDYGDMVMVAENVEYILEEESEDVTSARLQLSREQPRVNVLLDQRLMESMNVDYSSLQREMNAFSREMSSQTTFTEGDEEYSITIRGDQYEERQEAQRGMEDLQTLLIESQGDSIAASHHLEDFSTIRYGEDKSSIHRKNREKSLSVRYRFASEINEDKEMLKTARAGVDDLIAGLYVPPGVAVEVQHEEDRFGEFKFLILAAFVLIYMILASVFESFSIPFVLLFSIPLAAIGSMLGLIFTGNSLLNANTLTGFLILLGVVVNNGIIMIDFVQGLRRRGVRAARAIISAGLLRVRPILITVITTVIGMLPLALGQGEYVGSIGAPFAITVIGGLLFSTLFTLVIIPTAYHALENTLQWFSSLPLTVKILNWVALAGGVALAVTRADTLLWQMIGVAGVFIVVPALTWFITQSLRKASAEVIDRDSPIVIRVRNLVKIYDRPSRPAREWSGNQHLLKILGAGSQASKPRQDLIWQLPLLGFLGWFGWSYQSGPFWLIVLSTGLWLYILYLLKYHASTLSSESTLRKRLIWTHRKVLRFFPLVFLVVYQVKFQNPAGTIIWGLFIYLLLSIYLTSSYLQAHQVNTARITGRFARLRKLWIHFVRSAPLLGRKKTPFKALKSVSMDIPPGMFGLLGPNGAGKTTLMRVICGVLEQSYGKITINGIDTQEKREELQGLIGYLPQEFGMYENMTARDYLDYQAILKGVSDPPTRKERVDHVLRSVHMMGNAHKKIGDFSGGMKQRIGIAQVLLNLPRILVVDEPTAGLDPRERIRFRNLLVELSRNRVVIFSTHIIEDIASSCNQVAVLNKGELKYYGKPAEMAGLAKNRVWQVDLPADRFESLTGGLKVVHHMRKGDDIRVRIVHPEKPFEEAIPVTPVLEDAYLWLLNFGGTPKPAADTNRPKTNDL